MALYFYGFLAVFVVSAVSFIGAAALSIEERILRKYVSIFISLAVGSLLGNALIHIAPETFRNFSNPALAGVLIISGIFLFFIIEKFLHWHHHGEDNNRHHIHPVGNLILISDSVHNFIDGIIIGASFLVGIPMGVAATVAIILHEIPQEIGDFMVLLHSGYGKKRALWLNFISALSAIFGMVAAFILGGIAEGLIVWVLPIAAGGFIYIAAADLIPELHKTKENKYFLAQIAAVFTGVLIMLALALLE